MSADQKQTPRAKAKARIALSQEERAKRDEARHQKFRQLAIDRVPRALHRIKMLTSLANRANYVYTEQEAQRVIEVIREAVADMCTAYTDTRTQTAAFTF